MLMLQSVKARREEVLKLEGCGHIIVRGYSDENFRRHFRLRRGTVEILPQMIVNFPEIPSANQETLKIAGLKQIEVWPIKFLQ